MDPSRVPRPVPTTRISDVSTSIPPSQIEFFLDAKGQKRWRVQLAGNAEIIGSATEGYHNLTEAAENLVQLVQEVVKEAIADKGGYDDLDDILGEVRDHVMAIAAQGIPLDEQERFIAELKAPLTGPDLSA